MNELADNPPRPSYKWPKFVLAGVILFFVLTVVWMAVAVKRERQQRDLNAPLPGASAR